MFQFPLPPNEFSSLKASIRSKLATFKGSETCCPKCKAPVTSALGQEGSITHLRDILILECRICRSYEIDLKAPLGFLDMTKMANSAAEAWRYYSLKVRALSANKLNYVKESQEATGKRIVGLAQIRCEGLQGLDDSESSKEHIDIEAFEYRVGKLLLERGLATGALTEAELPIVRGVQNAK